MLSVKRRSAIVAGVLGAVIFLPAAALILFSLLDILVAKNPKITDAEYKAVYKATGRIAARGCDELRMASRENSFGWELQFSGCGEGTGVPIDASGKRRGSEAYTPFWIFLKNPVTNSVWVAKKNIDAKVSDPLDLFGGGTEKIYSVRLKRPIILWSPVLQSQASYEVGFYDDKNIEAATALIDATCGLLFELTTHTGGAGRLSLLRTDFPISRNRYFMFYAALLFTAIAAAIALARYWKSSRGENKDAGLWELEFVLWGAAACMVDIYADVWWPYILPGGALVALHLLALAPGWFRRKWWVLPGIVEIVWGCAIAIQTQDLIPQLSFCPGLIIAWMCATLFSGARRKK